MIWLTNLTTEASSSSSSMTLASSRRCWSSVLPPTLVARADFDWPRPDRRREFVRVRRNAEGALELFPNQSSVVLTLAVWGDGVVDIASGQVIRRGDGVRYLSFADLLAT